MSNDNNEDRNKIRRKKVNSSANSTSSTSRSKKRSSSSKKSNVYKILRVTGIVFLVTLVAGVAGAAGLVFSSLRDVQPVTKAMLDEKTYQTTSIYYSNGELLSKAARVNKKEPVSIDDISKDLQNAVVAIEDERFYEHSGVDIKGLFRSVVKTLMGNKQGGSTIPMQVSKMLLTTTDQTLPRKIKDIYYAYEMSKTLSKQQILEAYLNNFFVGRGLIGAEAGARGYFSKSASDLTLAESALLAGSTKNPNKLSAYTPARFDGNETKEDLENRLVYYIHTEGDGLEDPNEVDFTMIDKINSWGLLPNEDVYKQLKSGTMVVRKAINNPAAKQRQEVVLGKMLEVGYITQQEHDAAVAEQISIKLPKSADTVVSSVEDLIEYEVIDALMDQGNTYDEAYNLFSNGGLKIETTIDPKMQDILEDEYENNNNFPGHTPGTDGIPQPQSSMVILDYRTGQIKALVGGRHIKGRKTLNRATTPQQPGSTIKPLSVYTPAIDTMKLTQATALSDVEGGYKFKENNKWNPNTTTAGTGSMSLRKGLAYSSNTIAVKTAELLGENYEECVDIMIDYLKNFGITTVVDNKASADKSKSSDRTFSALTLGGMTKGVSPLQMAAAYGTLANGGIYKEPTIFTTITTYDGQLLVKNTPAEQRVVDPQVAYVLTDMLQAVITEGIGGAASIPNMPVAGKTGTTNKNLDAWFVGYTPYYVGATYIGDDAGRKNPDTGTTIARRGVPSGSTTTARLWSKVMGRVHENLTKTKFKQPDGVYFKSINLIDGGASSSGSSAAFVKGTSPSRQSYIPAEPQEPEAPVDETPTEETPPPAGGGENPAPPAGGGENPAPPAGGGENTTPPAGGGETTPTPPAGGGETTPTPPAGGGGNTGGATDPNAAPPTP
ncbi:penicillin-binding protein [Romboutsia weinsteinii]|uniref:Penicillin-binding protein 1A n=1 Tax=Romboutsia weinsteinii TaxID=2020949 RepID=A0A371J8V3_9FIRM|nr:transglycosylase domain-containing protein [Romboutsia weinsteinii]RDY29202.1 penicillin-binding protein [Romboutsia weinsteinii]